MLRTHAHASRYQRYISTNIPAIAQTAPSACRCSKRYPRLYGSPAVVYPAAGGRRGKKPPSLRCLGKNSPIPIIDARAVRRFAALRLFSVSLLCRSAAAPLRHSFLRSVVSLLLPTIDIACPPLQASTIVACRPHDIALFCSSTFYAACIYLGSASWTKFANSRYHIPCAPLRVFSWRVL